MLRVYQVDLLLSQISDPRDYADTIRPLASNKLGEGLVLTAIVFVLLKYLIYDLSKSLQEISAKLDTLANIMLNERNTK